MNIHSTNPNLFKMLHESTIVTKQFGSVLYGLNNKDSDVDLFHIYVRTDSMNNSVVPHFNNIQFKIDNIDHIFCSLDDFIHELIHGGSTVSFEVLHLLENTKLHWLYELRTIFYNYENVRSYLGVAKRDCKYHKMSLKKLAHAYRSYLYARKIMAGGFSFGVNAEQQTFIGELRNDLIENRDNARIDITEAIKNTRTELNDRSEASMITRTLTIEDYAKLDSACTAFKNTDEYKSLIGYSSFDMSIFYDAIVNGVHY